MGFVEYFMHDVIKMADNVGMDDGSFQPKDENEAIPRSNADTPINGTEPGATVNPVKSTEPPPASPSQPPQDPPANSQQDSPPVDFSEPERPTQTDVTPLVVVTGETASNNGITSDSDATKPEVQAGSEIVRQDSSGGSSFSSENAKFKDEESIKPSTQLTSDSNGERSRQESGSTEGSRGDGQPTRSRAQPVLDASKLKEKDNKKSHFRQQQINDRQKRIENLRHKGNDHRAEILERKKRQEQEDQARREAIVRRSRERSDCVHEKRRSWSAFGSRDYSSPVPGSGTPRTPRGRSTDRMTERPSLGGLLPLGTNKRLSSSVSSLHKPVHLVRLGPNENDWFEVHIPDPPTRRGSSPGNEKNNDSSSPLPAASSSATPRHHLSSPNLASAYPQRDSRSAHSTPTHISRPLSASKRSNSNSNSKLDESGQASSTPAPAPASAPAKRVPSPRTSLHGRPPSPRQQSSAPKPTPACVPSPRTIGSQGSTTVDGGSKPKTARAPSPRSLPKQTNGDSSKRHEVTKKTPGKAPPIKKTLTPRTDIVKSTVSSPTRSTATAKSAPKASTTKPATTPKGIPKQAKPAAVKAAAAAAAAAAAPEKPAAVKNEGEKEKTETKEVKPNETKTKETKAKETSRSQSPTISESSSGSVPSSNGSAPAAQGPPKDLTDEERAKQALAERRRQARVKAEREAELERQRQEQLKREEEERIRLEEVERIRAEEEAMRLAEEHKKAEEERLKRAIEENEEQEKLEVERKAAEEAEAAQRAEEERLRQEELKRQEEELAEKCLKEDEERVARKKRVEEIMKRARRGAQAKDKDDPSEDGDSGSESGSGSGSERKTNGVNNSVLAGSGLLNSEKYRNLLFNRNKTELSGEEDEDSEGNQFVGGGTYGKSASNSSDSEDKDTSEEGVELVDTLPEDDPEWSDDKEAAPIDEDGDKQVVVDEDEVTDECQDMEADTSDGKDLSEEGAESKGTLEEQPESCQESANGFGVDSDVVADMGGADEGLADEGLADEGLADEGLADEGLADEGLADEGLADEGLADEGLADEGLADEGLADEGLADEGLADEGLADEGLADEGTESEGILEEQPELNEESSDSFGIVNVEVTDIGVVAADLGAVTEMGVVTDMGMAKEVVAENEDVPVDPTTNGNGTADIADLENISTDDEKSEGSSQNGNEVNLPGMITPPVNNVPASDDFNNANGERLIEPIPQSTELITKKSLLDFGDGGGTLDQGGTIEVGEELSPDSASDKLNANLGMKAGFASDDASMTLSFSPLGEQQQQPMAVCVTPEDAV